ncbi:hypothetical protein ANTRET_LOCUS11014, partial [Anthophora retusa]
ISSVAQSTAKNLIQLKSTPTTSIVLRHIQSPHPSQITSTCPIHLKPPRPDAFSPPPPPPVTSTPIQPPHPSQITSTCPNQPKPPQLAAEGLQSTSPPPPTTSSKLNQLESAHTTSIGLRHLQSPQPRRIS